MSYIGQNGRNLENDLSAGGGPDATTASNGLTETGDNIKLGGTLSESTNIFHDNTLYLIGNSALNILAVTNNVDASYNNALEVSSNIGTAINTKSNDGIPLKIGTTPTVNSTRSTAIEISRGAVAGAVSTVGIATSIDFRLNKNNPTNTGNEGTLSNRITTSLTDIGNTTPTSKLSISGMNSGTEQDILVLTGAGLAIISQGAPEYADNAAAVAAGLVLGTIYRTGDFLKIVHP